MVKHCFLLLLLLCTIVQAVEPVTLADCILKSTGLTTYSAGTFIQLSQDTLDQVASKQVNANDEFVIAQIEKEFNLLDRFKCYNDMKLMDLWLELILVEEKIVFGGISREQIRLILLEANKVRSPEDPLSDEHETSNKQSSDEKLAAAIASQLEEAGASFEQNALKGTVINLRDEIGSKLMTNYVDDEHMDKEIKAELSALVKEMFSTVRNVRKVWKFWERPRFRDLENMKDKIIARLEALVDEARKKVSKQTETADCDEAIDCDEAMTQPLSEIFGDQKIQELMKKAKMPEPNFRPQEIMKGARWMVMLSNAIRSKLTLAVATILQHFGVSYQTISVKCLGLAARLADIKTLADNEIQENADPKIEILKMLSESTTETMEGFKKAMEFAIHTSNSNLVTLLLKDERANELLINGYKVGMTLPEPKDASKVFDVINTFLDGTGLVAGIANFQDAVGYDVLIKKDSYCVFCTGRLPR